MRRLTITKLTLTSPAVRRLQQRGLSPGDLSIVLRFGRKLHRAGATFYFFGQRQIPSGYKRELEWLVGTTMLVIDNQIITVYRHRRAIAKIKKKAKRKKKCDKRWSVVRWSSSVGDFRSYES